MSAFVCEKCGSGLRLSLPDRAYLCEESPREHRFDRGDAEQAWLAEASARVEGAPGDVDAAFQLASLCGRLASTSLRAGDPDPAKAYISQVVAVTEALYEGDKTDERVRAMFMEALVEQATVGEKVNDLGMAAAAYDRLVPFLEAEVEADPKSVESHRNLSVCLNGAGRMLRGLGNGVAAKAYFQRDLEVIEHLGELYPEQASLRLDRAVARFNLFLVSDVRAEEAEHLRAVLAILAELPSEAKGEQASQLERRARVELDRLESADDEATSRLAEATASVMRGKVGTEAPGQDVGGRAWLIEQVDRVLRGRRKRLPIVR